MQKVTPFLMCPTTHAEEAVKPYDCGLPAALLQDY